MQYLFYYKIRQTFITKCVKFFIKKCQFYYKMRQLLQNATTFLQNATAITKCDDYYKLQMQQDMLLLKLNHILMGLYIINKSMC